MVVKLTFPTTWHKTDLWSNFLAQSLNSSGVWGNMKYEINNETDNCDFWIVIGNLNKKESAFVRYETIFIPSEERESIPNYSNKFLSQFNKIATSREDMLSKFSNTYKIQYICPWQLQKTYDELIITPPIQKQKTISAIISNLYISELHKKRFILLNKLQGHFKDKLDWYGRGNIYIKDKTEGLYPYKYSIAIENSIYNDYWTEKIADCFLSYTMPIYFGCPNITDYFDHKSMILLNDIDDYKEIIHTIESAIDNKYYEHNIQYIIDSREKVLHQYQLFPVLNKLIQNIQYQLNKKVTILPIQEFTNEKLIISTLKKIYQRIK